MTAFKCKFPFMHIGSTPQTPVEMAMQKLRVCVLESRSMGLGDDWHLDLCSPFWRLYVNNRSGAWLTHQGRKISMGGGEPWLIPAWVRFQTGVTGTVRQDYLHFDVRGLPATFFQRIFNRPLRLRSSAALRALHEEWRAGVSFPQLCWATALAHAAFANAVEGWLGSRAGHELPWQEQEEGLRKAIEALETRLSEPPANPELARLSGSSEDHFIRRFRQATGMTPASYGRARRIAQAAEWLTSTNRTVEDIAASSGFTDRFHFSRVFKLRFSQAPVAYRRMHRRELAALAAEGADPSQAR